MNTAAAFTHFPLPYAVSRVARPEPHDGAPRAKRILFIDDEPDARSACGEFLRSAGFHVDLAADAAAGWDAVSAEPYDLVVTEHDLPQSSGLELVRKIRAISQKLPVILVSQNVPWDEPDLQWTVRPGALMQKPFSFAALLASVMDLLPSHGPHAARAPRSCHSVSATKLP